ncbi:MAG: HAMP domain-containing histidine kinase [Erysipelotrichaceae bacterium]|nr:HAMP domain-containing histidine kinase [Erysipelotrichaceae bacterium]
MTTRRLMLVGVLIALLEIGALWLYAQDSYTTAQDSVAVNELHHRIAQNWPILQDHEPIGELDYVVLDMQGHLLYQTRAGLSESIHAAIVHRDTILDVYAQDELVAKLIIDNDSGIQRQRQKEALLLGLGFMIFVQALVWCSAIFYLRQRILLPFQRLKEFAMRVAGGNLDVPLHMDRTNLFGAFTESFDLMRSELKQARLAEAKANAEKKELIAKLSHDMKTPIASIKATAEVGLALAPDTKRQEQLTGILAKADQMDALITNLFTASLEELNQLSVTPQDMDSMVLAQILKQCDYLKRAQIPELPQCIIYADPLRIRQVFDNLFTNSYKYADTSIHLDVHCDNQWLWITLEDEGGGVSAAELPFLTHQYQRGTNAAGIAGAGLGLYISTYLMKEMKGELLVENGKQGLRITVKIALSGSDLRNV